MNCQSRLASNTIVVDRGAAASAAAAPSRQFMDRST
jgi:hypothetical protein